MPRAPQMTQATRAQELLLRVPFRDHGADVMGNRCPESFPRDETICWEKGPKADRGFSLIEMLVAMVVLSLSLGTLYQAATGATRNVRVAAEYTDAVMLAESMLADNSYITEENFSNAGRFGQYEWVASSWPAPFDDGLSPEERGVAPQALQYLQVVVSWPGNETPRTLDLLTVVPLRESLE
jgi:general secretion pathway protein I